MHLRFTLSAVFVSALPLCLAAHSFGLQHGDGASLHKKGPRQAEFSLHHMPRLEGHSAHRAPDDGREYRTLLYEDFSRMTAGTDSTPDYSQLLNNSTGTILPEYTEIPGWGGSGIRSAGGNVCVDLVEHKTADGTYQYGGYITTPPLDLSKDDGTTYLSFRARSIDTAPGNLYITWTYPYEEGGQISSFVYDGWALYENIKLDNCTDNCEITIQAPSSRVIIDWIRIEKFKPELEAPEVLKWQNYDDSGEYVVFTPRWEPVEGAEQYELHVYRYYEDGVTTKKVVKETKLTDTQFDVTEEHKLDKQYTYYYYVVAKNQNFTSEPSGRVMVYDVMSPEITGVSDHSQKGYTASWAPVFRADGYGYFNSLTHTATKDETVFVMREGFDNVAGHPEATLENPYVSIIGLDDLDELPISRANWRLYEGAYIDGAVGMHNRFVGEDLYNGQLVSPTMVLGASDRVVTVSADFASATGTRPIVFLYCPVQDPQTGKTSWQVVDRKEISDITKDFVRHTVRLKATSSLCILNISLDDNNGFFFLDNLEISQNLKEGEYFALPYTYAETKSNEDTSFRQETPDRTFGDVYRFYVFAARELPGSAWFKRYVTSENSEAYTVPDTYIDGVRGVEADARSLMRVDGNRLTAREPLEIFRADGSSVAELQEGQSIGLDSGVYLCRSRKGNVKFIIR